MSRTLLAASLAAVVASGCSSLQAGPSALQYTCDDHKTLLITFAGDNVQVQREDGKSFVLEQEKSWPTFVYSTGRLDLRGTRDQVVWTQDSQRPATCQFSKEMAPKPLDL